MNSFFYFFGNTQEKMLSRGGEKFLEKKLFYSERKKEKMINKYNYSIVWGSYESNWRIQLQEMLALERRRIEERNECIRMGQEEIRSAKLERKISTGTFYFTHISQ